MPKKFKIEEAGESKAYFLIFSFFIKSIKIIDLLVPSDIICLFNKDKQLCKGIVEISIVFKQFSFSQNFKNPPLDTETISFCGNS